MPFKLYRLGWLGLGAICLILGLLVWSPVGEPRAGGHSLSYWLEHGCHPATGTFDDESAAALRQIGSKALIEFYLKPASDFEKRMWRLSGILRGIRSDPWRERVQRKQNALHALDNVFADEQRETFRSFVNMLSDPTSMGSPAYTGLIMMKKFPVDLMLQEMKRGRINETVLLNIVQNRTPYPAFNEFRLLVSDHPQSRIAGIQRLAANIAGELQSAAITCMFQDPHSDVRKAALSAFTPGTTSIAVREKAMLLLDDPDKEVQRLAEQLTQTPESFFE